MTDILLCSMPFGLTSVPSLGLSLLKATLAETPYSGAIRYFSLQFAEHISYSAYQRLWQGSPFEEVGDWLFAAAVFDPPAQSAEAYVEHILRHPSPALQRFVVPKPDWFVELALAARRQVLPFLERCLQEVERASPRMVGFTCMFQQRLASLALAQRIKARWPQTFVVFGGPACQSVPGVELLRQFPYVDAVVSGRGETVFPEMARRVMEGRPVTGLTGVYTQIERPALPGLGGYANAPAVAHLDEIPNPDFDDYFDELKSSNLSLPTLPALFLETSYGCWWGQKSQCTFCSQSGVEVAYCAKSSGRALAEIEYFARKYPGLEIYTTDNVLSETYFDEVLPALARRPLGARLFYQVRASLSKAQIRLLHDCGVAIFQPGIESLSSEVLRLMRKGTTLMDNLQCLKWAQELGAFVSWNLLYGFPGEPPEAYVRMAELVPLVSHLAPPNDVVLIRIGRLSPLFEEASRLGVHTLHPSPADGYIFPFEAEVLTNLATTFLYETEPPQPVESYTRSLRAAVETWQQVYPRSTLTMVDDGEQLRIHDRRPAAVQDTVVLSGLERSLYLACDAAQSLAQLQKLVADLTGQATSAEDIERRLQPMLDNKLMVREGRRILSLATSAASSTEP